MKLTRIKSKNIDERLLLAYLGLTLIGLVMIYSSSSIMAESRFGSHLLFLKNQFIWVLLSFAVIALVCRLDLKKLSVYSAPALLVLLLMLSLVFLMPARNGSHRWLMIAGHTVQPSELFKFVMIVYLAFSLANPRRNISDLKQLLFPYLPIIGLGLALIVMEPDLGTTTVIFLTALGIFFLAGARLKHLAVGFVPLISAAAFIVFGLGYKKARIMDFLASVMDPLQGSYQAKQAALTLGSGGILGAGLGEGRQKLFFLPYPHTDFIFASIGEEIGLLGLMIILSLFFYILWRGLKIASAQPDRFGYLLAAGVTWSLFINIAINIGVVTAILPVTGLPLPFLSYGGSSLLVSSASIAVLLNLSRRTVAV
ncbi:MAG: putative lipid II flippase FtsW [candidate division Zixibacteria bacterium]|nr:putative lipid II flippase FtsW [candidate division Zixibacteria bacterium]